MVAPLGKGLVFEVVIEVIVWSDGETLITDGHGEEDIRR